jgi:hypothetical protein
MEASDLDEAIESRHRGEVWGSGKRAAGTPARLVYRYDQTTRIIDATLAKIPSVGDVLRDNVNCERLVVTAIEAEDVVTLHCLMQRTCRGTVVSRNVDLLS